MQPDIYYKNESCFLARKLLCGQDAMQRHHAIEALTITCSFVFTSHTLFVARTDVVLE